MSSISAVPDGFCSSLAGACEEPVTGSATTWPPDSYDGCTYATSLPPSSFIGYIGSSAGDLARHFALPSARLIATISLAVLVVSVGR